MKGRARPPSSPESEESWTVDCPCGVNFDDGEEMVDCDECGVWVHTGCCHILKGHTSYVCDKCKFKKKKESEESEVAQLLVELPSKTPPLEEKVFTLRTELSREERAHVQGIPGGDPNFFAGVSPVFSRQLWKHTGYVPKLFQFNYNELPEEKAGACILFGDYAEKSSESPAVECTKSDHQIEEGKSLDTDMQPLGETHADKYYLSKDKYNKRELRKESKHRHRLQQEDGTRSHYHSKRRRDENSKKDFTSKKRTKNLMVEDYHGTPRRAFGEAAIPLKSSRIASRNPKAYAVYNSVEDVDGFTGTASNNNSKVDELGGYGGPQSLGFNSGEAGLASNSLFPKQVTTKAAHKVAPVLISRSEREGSNGNHRLADNISHQETHFVRRELEGAARNKFVAIKNDTSASGDVSKLKDQFSFGGHTDGKGSLLGYSHSTPADPKEASQRMRLNVRVSTKDQVEEFTTEEFSPSPVNEKTSQEHLSTPVQLDASLQLGKHHSSDDVSFASLSQKQSEMVDLAMTIQPICGGHGLSANASDDDERPLSARVTNELHAEDSPHVSTDQPNDQFLQDELARAKRQDLALLTPSSPVQQVLPQDANGASLLATSVSVGAVGNLHLVVDDSMKASPRSAQTGPSRSADMSSPTLSGPGVDSKQHGFTKVDSVSPPSERTLSVGPAQPVPSSKACMGLTAISNNRAYTSVVSKSGNTPPNLHVKSNSSSKHRSRTHDIKKLDATAVMLEDPNEMSTSFSSRKDFKELSKSSESKVAGTGKSLAARVALHPKTQSSHASAAKHMGQLPSNVDACVQANTQEQSLPQSRHPARPIPTSMPHKSEKAGLVAGSKNTTVLLSPSHASTLDLHMQGMECTRPVMNDEELAFLLHQELNSSPRVARVARVRQSGPGPHPLSAKRPAMATAPVASTANQKDPHLIFRRKNRDELHGEVARGADDASKVEVSGGSAKQDVGSMPHSRKDKDKDTTDACKAQMLPSAMTGAEVNRHHSPGSGVATERQLHSDSLGANDADDGERRASADSITTLPGLIEEILNEKGPNVSYDYICEEVLPHWSKLRKHNGERYAYTSHRQAVLDCLRNRSAWSHLIDRGPKTNLGRKRRRLESAVATESDHAEQLSHFQDGGEDHVPGKASKEAEIDGSESWPLSDSNKEADLSLPEEVPKGKRKARRGRRLTTQSKGYGARAHNGKGERVDESAQGVEDDLDHMVSPFSEEPASSSEDDEIFVHRGPGRHISRHRGSSVDSEDDDIDL
eukprot:c17883_g1_i1 orf=244-4020(+)